MEQKTLFEQLGGTCSPQGDYLLPDVALPEQKPWKSESGASAAANSSRYTTGLSITTCSRSAPCIRILQKSMHRKRWRKRIC